MTHLDTLSKDACEIVHPLPHQGDCVVLELLHIELSKVRLEANRRPIVRRLAGSDDGLGLDAHVLGEGLLVSAQKPSSSV